MVADIPRVLVLTNPRQRTTKGFPMYLSNII